MRSPAQAIIWEICWKNRWTLLLAFGLIPFCLACEWIVPPGHESIGALQAFSAVATFVSLIWVCSYTSTDSRGNFSGFPSWMYTLPLRTSVLVIWPMLLGIALMAIATVAWHFTIRAYWSWSLEQMRLGWHTLLIITTLVCVQALIWSLHRFRWIRMIALIAVIYGFFYVCMVGPLWNFPGGAGVWFGSVALVIPVAIAGAIAGVRRDRSGRWEGWTGKLLERLLDLLPRRSGAFKSAGRAQLWFEWRRRGIFCVVALGAVMSLAVFTYPLSAALYLRPVEALFNFSGPFIGMVVLAGQLGFAIGKPDPWLPAFTPQPIVAVRPLSTSGMVFAKMKVAATMTILGWILFVALLPLVVSTPRYWQWESEPAALFWQNFPADYPLFWRWLTNPVVIIALMAATWHTSIQAMSLVLTGSKRRIAISTWQGIIVLALVVGCALWLHRDPQWIDPVFRLLPWFTAMMMALKIIGAFRAFSEAKAIVSRRDFLILVSLWAAVAVFVLAAGFFAHVQHGLPPSLLWLLVLWQFFPANEIPGCVVALNTNRHR